MAVAHDAQTRFPATNGTTGVNSVDTTTGDRSFTHDPVGVPKGVVVVVHSAVAAAPVTGVTYAGAAMTLVATATDTTETGSVRVFALTDVAIPTDDPTTVVLQSCTADAKWATCSTVTAATTGTTVNDTTELNTTVQANPAVTMTTSVATLSYGGTHSGAAAPATSALTGCTLQFSNDYGAKSANTVRRTSEDAAGSPVAGVTQASDDCCAAAVALAEQDLPAAPHGPVIVRLQAAKQAVW